MEWKDFYYKYSNDRFKDEYSTRTEYLEYFKNQYPEEYRKYRDYLNKQRKEYYENLKVNNPEKYDTERLKHNKRLNKRYHNNKEYYKNYYKEYINRPGNREKANIRTKNWYYKQKVFKEEEEEKEEKEVKHKVTETDTFFIIDFSID